MPQTRWLINSRHILFTVLETESPRSGCEHGHILGRAFSHVADCQLLKYLHMVGVGEGVIQTSFIRLLFQFMKFLPHHLIQFSSVQSLSCVRLFAILWTAARDASSITNSQSLLKSCPLSKSCHPIISSSVVPCFSLLQSFSVSGSFQMSQHFTTGGQSIGVSASM